MAILICPAPTNNRPNSHDRTRTKHLGIDRSGQTRPSRRTGHQGRAEPEAGTGPAADGAKRGASAGTEDRRTCLPRRGRSRYAIPVRRGGHAVALARLADAIFAASRVDNDDPIAAWAKHNATLRSRTEWLNGQRFSALRYSGPGTDLTIGLADGHEWEGGASTARNGITCNANIPTEEVFTTPHARRVNGHVVSTKPLS